MPIYIKIARWLPWFAHLGGRSNAPHGGGATRAQYLDHVQGLRTHVFADQLNLIQVAEALCVRIYIIPQTPQHAGRPWAITTVDPARSHRSIYLGNNDLHYVWLRRTDA